MANSVKTEQPDHRPADEGADLVHRYGKIGISALAAAARYQGDARPADCPEKHSDTQPQSLRA